MNTYGRLFIVGTPIGNLGDITLRAIEILKNVSFVACEDTRVTKKLLNHIGSEAQTIQFHAHSGEQGLLRVLTTLQSGHDVAYVTDAGTPGISDPGNELVFFLRNNILDLKIIPIPGVSALTTIASVSGFNLKEFTFSGFVPKKKNRSYFSKLLIEDRPFVFYDSPHRVVKNLDTVITLGYGLRRCVVGRELTKMYETLYSGTVESVKINLQESKNLKGELVIVISNESNILSS